jgi:hypothetical protein
MRTIKLKSGSSQFEIHAYKAGESVSVFPGSTGTFGRSAGSKTAGIVYVVKNGGVQADDCDVDNERLWSWIGEWMQKGFSCEDRVSVLTGAVKLLGETIERMHNECPNEQSHALVLAYHEALEIVGEPIPQLG